MERVPGVALNWRRGAREVLGRLLEEHTFLTTRVESMDEINSKFVERVGFKKTWSDNQFNYFMLARVPFQRKES